MKDFFELYDLFVKINKKGWVKSLRKGPGGIGYTFESLLGKNEDGFPMPDFRSIEIKTMRYKSRRVLHLFTLAPDGDYLFPIKRILEKIGYPSKWNPEYKVLMVNANTRKYSMVGWSRKICLYVNRKEKKLEVHAFKSNGEKININISWSFDVLRNALESKMKNLAIIKADNKIINSEEYFHYRNIRFFKLRGFDTFISLIENGIITVNFNIDVFKEVRRIGQIYDHGTSFSLKLEDIDSLYQRIRLDIYE